VTSRAQLSIQATYSFYEEYTHIFDPRLNNTPIIEF